jgi:hypothetical protein
MDKPIQLGENFPIHAYLSYRCNNPRDIAARHKLKNLCKEQNIALRYDESETEQGDSLIHFMEDLTAARCIFLFLSPDYFQSAYTLFELVSINERADLGQRFILPLRLTESMVTYQWTAAKNYFNDNPAVRNELARLLKVENDNHDAIWLRINEAWETIIFKYLDRLNVSLEHPEAEGKLIDLLKESSQQVKAVIFEAKQNLHETISKNILKILKNKHIPRDQLAEVLQLDSAASIEDITESGILAKSVSTVLDMLYKLSTQRKKQLCASSDAWDEYLYDVEQLCGWLLLKTVDPIWWFQNQLLLQRSASQSITGSFKLQQPAYIEVLIARSLLQRAQYSLDEFETIKPVSEEHDVMLFDAISFDAADAQLLSPIYKDLRKANKAPQDVQRLLADIVLTARALIGSRDGKPIYYIVSETYLKSLKSRSWFTETEQKLKGCLQFICCVKESSSPVDQPCIEEQDILLEKVANILRLKNTKGTIND